MRQIFVFLRTLFICLFTMNPLVAIEFKDKLKTQSDLRILNLLPNLVSPLAVEPGIPADFIPLSLKGTLDPFDWIYWGPEDTLKAYFENPDSLNRPILRVKLSANVSQFGPNGFVDEKFIKMLQKDNPGSAFIKTQWGDYPVLGVRTKQENSLIFMAWVGLNDLEAGWTLMFNLVYPDREGHPNKEDRQLWESLIMKTTPLKDRDFFKACGQDLQEGCTLVNLGGAKLKMFAEKRQSDGALQVVVVPESSDIMFHYVDMKECLMAAEWKQGEPMVKVYGTIIVNNERENSTTYYVTSIFFKTVTEFSFKKDNEKELLIFTKSGDKKV